ncbi:hypothetical protein vseg_018228 [Gypsophila vaccaria]
MATISVTSTLITSSSISSHTHTRLPCFPVTMLFQRKQSYSYAHAHAHAHAHAPALKALALDFSSSFFEGGFSGLDEDPTSSSSPAEEDKPEPQCPPGLRQYETMVVLRPDMTEDERLSLTQKYEELLIAGGAMYVEVFNRGVIPLSYSINKKNKSGEKNTYLDGIYLLFTYFTNPDSITALEETLQADDNVIRSSTFKIRKRKY